MRCVFTTLVLLGLCFAGLIWWLVQPARWSLAFNGSWLWPVLDLILLRGGP